jgi:hypothetical protein
VSEAEKMRAEIALTCARLRRMIDQAKGRK